MKTPGVVNNNNEMQLCKFMQSVYTYKTLTVIGAIIQKCIIIENWGGGKYIIRRDLYGEKLQVTLKVAAYPTSLVPMPILAICHL